LTVGRCTDLPADDRWRPSALLHTRSFPVISRNHGVSSVWSRKVLAVLQLLDRHRCRIRRRRRHRRLRCKSILTAVVKR